MDLCDSSDSPHKKRMKNNETPDAWQITLQRALKNFESSNRTPANPKWTVCAPENSMAWKDLKKGHIACGDDVPAVNLPPSIGKMFAEDARKTSSANAVELNVSKVPWAQRPSPPPPSPHPSQLSYPLHPAPIPQLFGTPIPTLKPLMSLNLDPPPSKKKFFTPIQKGPGEYRAMNKEKMDEAKIFSVLSRVNTVMKQVGDVLETAVRACIEPRRGDNSMCLFIFFNDFPWPLIGGCADLGDHRKENPPPPEKIYEAWRSQFLSQLSIFLPKPLLSKIERHVDLDFNMNWSMNLLESDDFKVITAKIVAMKNNPAYARLWNHSPWDYDLRDAENAALRAATMRHIEAEVKSFWTYEKIGIYLRMLPNYNQNVTSNAK